MMNSLFARLPWAQAPVISPRWFKENWLYWHIHHLQGTVSRIDFRRADDLIGWPCTVVVLWWILHDACHPCNESILLNSSSRMSLMVLHCSSRFQTFDVLGLESAILSRKRPVLRKENLCHLTWKRKSRLNDDSLYTLPSQLQHGRELSRENRTANRVERLKRKIALFLSFSFWSSRRRFHSFSRKNDDFCRYCTIVLSLLTSFVELSSFFLQQGDLVVIEEKKISSAMRLISNGEDQKRSTSSSVSPLGTLDVTGDKC